VLGFVAIVFNAGLAIVAARDLALLPGRSGYTVRRAMPEPFSLGEPEEVAVVVQNRTAAGLMATIADHAPATLRPEPREVSGRFDANGLLHLSYRTHSPKRGAYRFGRVDLQVWRQDGWWRRQVKLPDPQEVAVFPNVVAIKRIQLSLRRGLRAMAGMRRARPPGASTAFAGLRDYVRGDDVRRVSWTATARRDRPVVVEVEAERGQQVIIAIDCGRLMTAPAGELDKLDHAVNAALMLAWVAQAYGDRVGMMTFDDRVTNFIKPERGAIQLRRITEALYSIKPEYVEPDFGHAMTHLALRVGRRSMVVMLTDVQDPEASRELVAHALRLAAVGALNFIQASQSSKVQSLMPNQKQLNAEPSVLAPKGTNRRDALWQVERVARSAGALYEGLLEKDGNSPLLPMTLPERMDADFRGTGLTIGKHPVAYHRAELDKLGALRALDVGKLRNGSLVRIAGWVIVRQRPGTAKGFVFLTLEDETGVSNVIITPQIFDQNRLVLVDHPFLLIEGTLQNQDNVVSVKAKYVQPLSFKVAAAPSHDFH